MWRQSLDFCKNLDLTWPAIIQAPMAGGITRAGLVAAVANTNGLGSLATGYLSTEHVTKQIHAIQALTTRPFAVNVFIPEVAEKNQQQINHYQQTLNPFRRELGMADVNGVPDALLPEDNFHEIIDVLCQENIKIVSFTFGNLPQAVIKRLKQRGIYLIGTATSLEEASILSTTGIDAIVMQGYEAGGHRGGFCTPSDCATATMPLVSHVSATIKTPLIAAGGIMNGQGIVAALAAGAAAVQMGTAFLTTQESGANDFYKQTLIHTKHTPHDATTLTRVYSGKLARGIKTEFVEQMEKGGADRIPPYPITNALTRPIRKKAAEQQVASMMSMWAGQGLPLISDNLRAETLITRLRQEMTACLSALAACRQD